MSVSVADIRHRLIPHAGVAVADEWVHSRSSGNMKRGSILFHAPSHAFQAPGGGENQLVQTGKQLERLGHAVRLFSLWNDRLDEARLLHLFGMSREGVELAQSARRHGLPVALSPICWFDARALIALAPGRLKGALDATKWSLKRLAPRARTWRGELLDLADVVLPNSEAEAEQLIGLFGVKRSKIRVVPNGVDPSFAQASPDLFVRLFGPPSQVLYVGRIEPRKNVLRLIEACDRAKLTLTVIGSIPAGYEDYVRSCREAGREHVRFLSRVDHHDPILASAFAAHRVFALPSWFETPGLAAIEAALAGAAVVITPYGCTREYFGEEAIYARPERVGRIADALSRAYREGAKPELAARLCRLYPWAEVARRTAEAYDHVTQ